MSTSRKDEIIRLQNEIIQSMAKRNLQSVYNDFFPVSRLEPQDKKPSSLSPSDEILNNAAAPDATAKSDGNGKTTTDAKAAEMLRWNKQNPFSHKTE